jgi:HEAT repeat protein
MLRIIFVRIATLVLAAWRTLQVWLGTLLGVGTRPEPDAEARLRGYLCAVHPLYEPARKLGRDAVAPIRKILEAPDDPLAYRAAYLATLLGETGTELVRLAVRHPAWQVRTATAFGLAGVPPERLAELLMPLLGDVHHHVAYRAVETAAKTRLPAARPVVEDLASRHPAAYVRNAARQALAGW